MRRLGTLSLRQKLTILFSTKPLAKRKTRLQAQRRLSGFDRPLC
jgi:hypothetical protein